MEEDQFYVPVDNQCISVKCWLCGNKGFTNPVYTIADVQHAVRMELSCLKCRKSTYVGLHHDGGEMVIVVRKTEL